MKLVQEKVEIISSHTEDSRSFEIDKDSEHIIFDILRSKVYSNPIESICREVASNSRDSHREAGVDRPIEIHIVRGDDVLFDAGGMRIIFRDFGVGISPERMRDVYTKYGASTKRGTNDLTGGFGLGAKTPFSYVDQFSVVTVFDGVKYAYSVYIDESRKGKVALMSEVPCSDGNGTDIVVPLLKHHDLELFEEAVLKSTLMWKERPVLVGFRSSHAELTPLIEGEGFRVLDTRHGHLHHGVTAVIDGVMYPLGSRVIGDEDSPYGSLQTSFRRDGFGIFIDFDNGDLTVSANRETLQFDERTVATLERRLLEVVPSIMGHFDAMYEGVTSYAEAWDLHQATVKKNRLYEATQSYRGWTLGDGRAVLLRNTPLYLKGHKVTLVSHDRYRDKRATQDTNIYHLRRFIADGCAYYKGLGDSEKRRSWITACREAKEGKFILVEQTSESWHYLDHDAGELSLLGIDFGAIKDMKDVPAAAETRATQPARKPRNVISLMFYESSHGMTRSDFTVQEDGTVTIGGVPVRLAIEWVESEARKLDLYGAKSIGLALKRLGYTFAVASTSKSKVLQAHRPEDPAAIIMGNPSMVEAIKFGDRIDLIKDIATYGPRGHWAKERASGLVSNLRGWNSSWGSQCRDWLSKRGHSIDGCDEEVRRMLVTMGVKVRSYLRGIDDVDHTDIQKAAHEIAKKQLVQKHRSLLGAPLKRSIVRKRVC